jgi:deoxyribonuclease V
MHLPPPLHRWNVSAQEAIALQKALVAQLQDRPLPFAQLRTVAGVDVSVKDGISRAAVVVMRYPSLAVIEAVTHAIPTPFPYIPGLLTFREGQVVLEAVAMLQHEPDVFMFDGMGRIHPRGMGIAAHLGLWLQRPTLGIGKTQFIGEYPLPAPQRGSYAPITYHGQVIGASLTTRPRVKPIYVSAGHLCDLDSALALAMTCTPRYRQPEPIRQAHHTAGKVPDIET